MILKYLIFKNISKERIKDTIKDYLSDDLEQNEIDITKINFNDHHVLIV